MRANRKIAIVLASTIGLSLALFAPAAPAQYAVTNVFASGGTAPVGIAIDQASGEVYVANLAAEGKEIFSFTGLVAKFDAHGVPGTPASMSPQGGALATGAAVDPSDSHVDAFYISGSFNTEVTRFDPTTGSVDAGFPFTAGGFGIVQIATDDAGDIYVPSGGSVQELSNTGTLLNTFECSACPGGAFSSVSSVTLDSTHDTLYAADRGNGRVMKIATNDPTGANATVFYQGASSALAFDPTNEHVFIGGDDGNGFHITEHEASGAQTADFGQGEFTNGLTVDQIAVNPATGEVYVTDTDGNTTNRVLVYSFVPPPTATTGPASNINQTKAMLNATVNPGGAETITCHFEYGHTTEYGKAAVCSPEPKTATVDTAILAKAIGLSPNTTYHYRVYIRTTGGETHSTDQSFTTPPEPSVAAGGGAGAAQPVTTPSPAPGTTQTPPPATCKTDTSLCPKPKPRSKPVKCRQGFTKKKIHGRSKCVKVRRKQVLHKHKTNGNKKKHH